MDRLAPALAAVADRRGDAPWLVWHDEEERRAEWSFAAAAGAAARLAGRLAGLGLEPGDRVAVLAGNRPEVLLAYLACWWGGFVATPIDLREAPARKAALLARAGCRAALAWAAAWSETEALAAELPALRHLLPLEEAADAGAPLPPRPLPPDRGAFLVFTSGTTGAPKGVLLSQGNLLANARATAAWHRLAPGDGVLTTLPIHHVNGAVVTGLTSFLAGGRNALEPRFSPARFWRRLEGERLALASVVPTLLEFLLGADEDLAGRDLGALRYLLCGAGPLLRETALRFEARFGVAICHGFGMSEATAYNTQFPMELPREARLELYRRHPFPSVGCALACNEVAVLRDDGTEAARLERGEIAVRGASVMAGYLDDPEATGRAFRDGWFLSGDEGFWDLGGDGRRHLFVSGRRKELIVRGGVNLSPLEIDEALRRVPGVAFALALPFENVAYGEEVAAYVVPEPGAAVTEAAVRAAARAALPFAMRPKVVLFGDDVPFTATGKPRRVELARRLAPRLASWREVQFREEAPGDGGGDEEGAA